MEWDRTISDNTSALSHFSYNNEFDSRAIHAIS